MRSTAIHPQMASSLRVVVAAATLFIAESFMGYSVLRLAECAEPSVSAYAYQLHQLRGDGIVLANGSIFGVLFMMWDAVGAAVRGATLWTSTGSTLSLAVDASGAETTIAASNGLCVATMDSPAMPNTGLWLQPCDAGASDQVFRWLGPAGMLVHAASGLCIDGGSQAHACARGSSSALLPFCNVSLPLDVRVADLVSKLSVTEKQAMLDTSSGGSGPQAVPALQWWNEALHGVAKCVSRSRAISPSLLDVQHRVPAHSSQYDWRLLRATD